MRSNGPPKAPSLVSLLDQIGIQETAIPEGGEQKQES
ncbi:hypothetical protein SLEP1_g21630 [Rubroshorea leprosula]|nr:hypothetical protein SLEP1_g21630 [Rubroshorea leprosula]